MQNSINKFLQFFRFYRYGSGVDLNCNFPFQYNSSQSGCSNDPCNPYYRGTGALSEKETQTIDKFLKERDFNFAVNYFRYICYNKQKFNF